MWCQIFRSTFQAAGVLGRATTHALCYGAACKIKTIPPCQLWVLAVSPNTDIPGLKSKYDKDNRVHTCQEVFDTLCVLKTRAKPVECYLRPGIEQYWRSSTACVFFVHMLYYSSTYSWIYDVFFSLTRDMTLEPTFIPSTETSFTSPTVSKPPTMPSPNRPKIPLLNLASYPPINQAFPDALNPLSERANLHQVHNADKALTYLTQTNSRAILVTDPGLLSRKSNNNNAVLEKVLSYIRNGGLVILSFFFASSTTFPVADRFFNDTCGLPWTIGDYTTADVSYNPYAAVPEDTVVTSFPGPFYMKALHVSGAREEEKIVVPTRAWRPHRDQAVVVGCEMGSGYMVFIGDVNMGPESAKIIQGLCGF